MQVVRTIVILFGLVAVTAGLYLFVLGVGAPIEIKSIEVGSLKASATGTFVGLLVAAVGLGVLYIAAQHMKRKEHWEVEEQSFNPTTGQPEKIVTRKFLTEAAPPEF